MTTIELWGRPIEEVEKLIHERYGQYLPEIEPAKEDQIEKPQSEP